MYHVMIKNHCISTNTMSINGKLGSEEWWHVLTSKVFISAFKRFIATELGRVLISRKSFSMEMLKSSPTSCFIYKLFFISWQEQILDLEIELKAKVTKQSICILIIPTSIVFFQQKFSSSKWDFLIFFISNGNV